MAGRGFLKKNGRPVSRVLFPLITKVIARDFIIYLSRNIAAPILQPTPPDFLVKRITKRAISRTAKAVTNQDIFGFATCEAYG